MECGFRDEVAIVLAGSTPEVVVGMSGHTPTLRDAVNAISFSDSPTHLTAAIALGRQLIGQHPHGQVVVLTDGAVDDSRTFAGLGWRVARRPLPAAAVDCI